MENGFKLCEEIIKDVRRYLERKDYTGLALYLDEKEKYVDCCVLPKDPEEEYLDKLVKDLK